ncbi:MAG: holin [Bacillota bacterium]|jgi:toxin secretion/phage lysis holin|nr:MAG: holin [Bacillota bacterium]
MQIDTWTAWAVRLFGLAAAVMVELWSGLAPLVQILILMMLGDVVSGLLAGYVTRSLSSEVSFRGAGKKAMMLLLVGVAYLLNAAAAPELAGILPSAVAGFLIAHEGLSIVENATRAGVPVPKALRDALAKVPGAEPPEVSARNNSGGS